MSFVYDLLRFVHIAAAITAVGANVTYGVWNALGAREPAHMAFMLKGVRFLDNRVANPAYGLLFLTGLAMIFVGHWSITSLWLVVAIILFIAVAAFAGIVFTPLVRDQIKLAEAGDTASAEFTRLANRNRMAGIIVGVAVVAILVMMVFKPTL